MRALLAALAAAGAASLSGCNGGSGTVCACAPGEECVRGRCFVRPTAFEEPVAVPATCGPPAQSAGGPVAAPEPAGCAAPVRESTAPGEWVTRVPGPVAVGSDVQVTVPAGASSLTIVLQAANPPESGLPVAAIAARRADGSTGSIANTAVPLLVTAPDGLVWFDDAADEPADVTGQLVFFGSEAPAVGTITIPNTTRALREAAGGLPAGAWTIRVSDYAFECATIAQYASLCAPAAGSAEEAAYRAGLYDVTVIVKPGPRPAPGTLDLALYLHRCPGAEYDANGACLETPLTSAGALSDPDAQRMVRTLASLASRAGICLGTVTWHDLPEWAQERWAAGLDLDATDCAQGAGQLFAASAPGNHMNLFLLPDITTSEGDPASRIVGIDGTIPGPATMSGTMQSGAVVSAANLRFERTLGACGGAFSPDCGADTTAYIAAHEAGHFLGLYHATERSGLEFDPLSDTPECRCDACAPADQRARCASGGVLVSGAACLQSRPECSGGRNLMFWLLERSSQGKVSPEQSEVLRSSPLVH